MGTWIELRCEKWADLSKYGCYSHRNEGPMGMAGDTTASVLDMLRSLANDGRNSGWRKTRDGWLCPCCVKLRDGHTVQPPVELNKEVS